METYYTNRTEIGDVIRPYNGKTAKGVPIAERVFSDIQLPKNHDLEFVVERTEMEGGGTGHGPYDIYPDGWHVTARQLHDDGTYNPAGTTIQFYQSGCFTNMIEQVPVVRKMRMMFVEATP